MAIVKYYNQEVVVAANANVQQFTLNTPDNWQAQTITGIFADLTTARNVVGIMVTGDQKITVAAPIFAAGNDMPHFSIDVPPQTPPTLTVQDQTGTGTAHVNVTIRYEVAQG